MGGGQKVQQTNVPQATASNAGATSAANTGNAISQAAQLQSMQQYKNLFGADGKSGSISPFMDPKSLNVSSPTGVFALQNTGANQAAAGQYAQNKSNITSAANQAGFGPNTPAGFVQDQQDQNARNLADTKGTNFGNSVSNQYSAALDNFWKANNMAQQQGTASQGAALSGNNTAAQTYGNLYGTAGKGNVTQNSNLLGDTISAAGNVGGAAMLCVAFGTAIRTDENVSAPAETLRAGDRIMGVEGKLGVVHVDHSEQECVEIRTERGLVLICSLPHTLLRPGGGYVKAAEAKGAEVRTADGKQRVTEVKSIGVMHVVKLEVDGSHTYLSNGIWSEE